MTLLCIDVGNSRTELGLFVGSELVEHWRVATDDRRTADEWAVLVNGLLTGCEAGRDVRGVCVCSTVPSVLHEMRDMLVRYFPGAGNVIVEPGVKTGLPILMDNPREVGTDRIANALAANHLVGGPCVVVDFGTATTFDVVSAKGEYIGGAIAPGIEISLAALGERGAQLRKVELVQPRSVIAKNTVEALQSGVIYGFAGQVDGLVSRMAAQLGVAPSDLEVIATGSMAPVVIDHCTTVTRHEPWLGLHGLRLIHARNNGE
jgi:type III pantothenate kinase